MTLKEVEALQRRWDAAVVPAKPEEQQDPEVPPLGWSAAPEVPPIEVVIDKRNGDVIATRVLPLPPPVQAPSKVPPPKPLARTRERGSHRQGRRAASRATSRRGPPSDDPSPARARSPLSQAERAFLRAEVDRRVRQGIADQRVLDKAIFKAVAAWGEAEVVR